jgi:hypothetical protein
MLALAGMQYCNKANLHKINNYVQASYTAAKQKLFNLPKTSTPDELLIQRHPLARFI